MPATVRNSDPATSSSTFYINVDAGTTYPVDCAANGPTATNITCAKRFICTTSGTLNVKRLGGASVALVVLAGQTYDLQIAEVTSRTGAIGILCW